MPTKILLAIAFFSISFFSNAQDESLLVVATIPSELTTEANAVVRYNHKKIEISSLKSLSVAHKRIVTILNKAGNRNVEAYVSYDKGIDIKKIEAKVYDQFGNQIKKFKKSDFEDVSAANDFSLYEDSRVKYLNYTPTEYPYTIEFYYETNTNNTAFIPSWYPLEGYYVSTQKSVYEIAYETGIDIKQKEYNFKGYEIINNSQDNNLLYEVNNIKAIKSEDYSPDFKNISPHLGVALNKFHYEGFYGESNDWTSLGKWMYDELLVGRTELPETTKSEIKALVMGIDDPIEKAKVVYNFVQQRTRYISVQEGIGGIQPIEASKVDEVKYGDCKGLTNYTKALMDVVGVKTNYSRVYASRSTVDIDKEFVTFLGQTNHVILNLPTPNGDIWLECTSQTSPFGYNANFTDDRDVFVITPEGGKIVHTQVYDAEKNLLETNSTINLSPNGSIDAKITSSAFGARYDYLAHTRGLLEKDQKLFYKEKWGYLGDLTIDSMSYNDDRDSIVFTETIQMKAERYATKVGNRLLLQPNFFNREQSIPKRYSKRKLPFEIERGYINRDSYIITIPNGFMADALIDSVSIETKFGSYTMSISKHSDSELFYKRELKLNKGIYSQSEYNDYRDFWIEVTKNDKAKIVLKPNL